jgi:mannitol 2-dehydrogenase
MSMAAMDELMTAETNGHQRCRTPRSAICPKAFSAPTYDRGQLTPGIVHIGLGNFHRAHQAWYLHRLMQQGLAQDWAIIGAGVRPYDAAMREKLLAQDCLTTLIELAPGSRSAEVTGAMIDYLPVEEGNGALIRAHGRSAIRIVSLTVTEGGILHRPRHGRARRGASRHPPRRGAPRSPAHGLRRHGRGARPAARRRATGRSPGSVCDNLRAMARSCAGS